MSGLRKGETQELIRSLVAQGCRAEWSGAGIRGSVAAAGFRFPVKLYPPDPNQHFILIHETLSDTNSVTLKRADVRRAGLVWPFDDKKKTKALEKAASRKENPMSNVAPTGLREHGTHLVVPPGVRNRAYDPQEAALDAVRPFVAGMAGAFWTDELVAKLKAARVPGFNAKSGGASVQRAQDLLDWLGFRVMESRPNRGGFSYRWVKEAEARPGRTEGRVTPIRAEEPVVESPAPTLAAGFQVFEKPHKTKYERRQCETCQRWFTPDGYENHIEATQHGENKPVVSATTEITAEARAAIEALRGGPVDLEAALAADPKPEPEPQPAAEPLQPETTTMVSRSDYEAMESLATEAQEEATELRSQLADASEAYERLMQKHTGVLEAAAIVDGQRQQEILQAREDERREQSAELTKTLEKLETAVTARATLMEELDREREARNRAQAAREEAMELLANAVADDGSWLLDLGENRMQYVYSIVDSAARMGVEIEIRARRAR